MNLLRLCCNPGTTSLAGTVVGRHGHIDMGLPRGQKALSLMTL